MNRNRRMSLTEIRNEVRAAVAERVAHDPAEEFSPGSPIGFAPPTAELSSCCRAPIEDDYCSSCRKPASRVGRVGRSYPRAG